MVIEKKMKNGLMIEGVCGICLAIILWKMKFTNALEILYFPFEGIGKSLRWMSLHSWLGNLAAIVLYMGISMIPLFCWIRKKKHYGEDILLWVMTAILFYSLYQFINPGRFYELLPERFRDGTSEIVILKTMAASVFYSVLTGYLMIKGVYAVSRKSDSEYQNYLYRAILMILFLMAFLFVIIVSYGMVFQLLQEIETYENNPVSQMMEVIKLGVQVVPFILSIGILLNGMEMMESIKLQKENLQILSAKKLAKISKQTVVISVLLNIIWNMMQIIFSKKLTDVHITWDIPLETLAVAFAALIFAEYFYRTKALKEENEQFI